MVLALVGSGAAQPNLPSPERTYSFDQRLGVAVPAELPFRDEVGRAVPLGDALGRPTVLVLAQYRCPMLCNEVLNGLTEGLRGLAATAGTDFEVLVVSFDPRETAELAAAKRDKYVQKYGRPGGDRGWHFWTGEQDAIDRLAAAVGFRYAYSRPQDRYAHPSGLVVLTPAGKVSGYLFGIDFPAERLRAAIDLAAADRVGRPVPAYARVLLLCYDYDPATGGWSVNVLKAVRAAGLLTVIGLALGLLTAWRRERKRLAGGGCTHGT